MNVSHILGEFKNLAQRLGIEIRYTEGGPSGLCSLKGKKVMFIDRTLDEEARLELFIKDFSSLDLEGVFVVPIIKKLLGKESSNGNW